MVKLLDRVKQAVSGTASNTTLGAAATGFRTFNTAGAATNDVCRYAIEDDSGAFEIGTIVINSATTGTRTVQISSNSNNALTLTGNAVIFATLSAADLSGNAAPIWTTTPPSNIDLNNDGSTAVTLAGVAIDEFPVHYSWDGYSGTTVYNADSLPPQLASAPTFSGGTASLIGSSTSSNAGSFNFRLKASDGVKTATSTTLCKLEFMYNTNLVGWYDAADTSSYSGSGNAISDKSGNSGPTLALHDGTSGSVVYNSSGTGSLASFTTSGYYSFKTTHNFGTGQSVVLILRMTADGTIGVNGSAAGGTAGMFIRSFSAPANLYGSSWQTASAGSEIFVDKTSFGTGSTPTSPQIRTAMIGSGVTSATALQYHSLVQTGLDLSNGFTVGNSYALGGEIRAILIYDQALTNTQVTLIHDFYKGQYSSDSDMAP